MDMGVIVGMEEVEAGTGVVTDMEGEANMEEEVADMALGTDLKEEEGGNDV
jgi:hypothetical protein